MPRRKKKAAAVKAPGTALALPKGGVPGFLAEMAAEEAKREARGLGVRSIRFNKGTLEMGEEDLGDELDVIIVDTVFENAYYETSFDPNNPANPNCFAIAEEEAALSPHPNSLSPQAGSCEDCWASKFGSADKGRGKACGNKRRLAILPGDAVDNPAAADPAFMKMSSTTIKNYKKYVNMLSGMYKIPLIAVVTRLSVVQEENYFVLEFDAVQVIDDEETVRALIERRELLHEQLMAPYEDNDVGDNPAPKPRGKKKAAARKKIAAKVSPQQKKAVAKKKAAARKKTGGARAKF